MAKILYQIKSSQYILYALITITSSTVLFTAYANISVINPDFMSLREFVREHNFIVFATIISLYLVPSICRILLDENSMAEFLKLTDSSFANKSTDKILEIFDDKMTEKQYFALRAKYLAYRNRARAKAREIEINFARYLKLTDSSFVDKNMIEIIDILIELDSKDYIALKEKYLAYEEEKRVREWDEREKINREKQEIRNKKIEK